MAETYIGKPCKRGHDGLRYRSSSDCVQCAIERSTKWQRDNPEAVAVKNKRWDDAHPEQVKRAAKIRRAKDPEKYNARTRRWRALDGGIKARAATERWRQDKGKPAKVAIELRRRAHKAGAEGSHTREEVLVLFEQQQGLCGHCHAQLHLGKRGFTEDHKIPISRGGSDYITNIWLLCRRCNCSKNDRTVEEWYEWLCKMLS
jgi:5-methylcytosine-specific restriction endonuclease McrA